jgi:hypothetical protein
MVSEPTLCAGYDTCGQRGQKCKQSVMCTRASPLIRVGQGVTQIN